MDWGRRRTVGLMGRWIFSQPFLFSGGFWLGQLCRLAPTIIHSSSAYAHFNCLQQISGGKWSLVNPGCGRLDDSERGGPA